MPVYSINCFQLSKEICGDTNQGIAQFCDLHHFNQDLLANQVSKISKRPESIVYKVLRGGYFPNGNIMLAQKALNLHMDGNL